MNVARFDIRLLGEVTVLADGTPRKLLPQTAKALAMLVSARNPVPQGTLAAALGNDGPVTDVAPPLSRLRNALAGSELDIPPAKWSHAYELVERTPGYLAETLDAARFEARLREGRELYERGDPVAALTRLREAAAEWRGAPFASLAAAWALPWVCEGYRARLEEQRTELVRLVARIALRLGRYEKAAFLSEGVVGDGQDDTTAVWLLRFLTTLRTDGGAAAGRAVRLRDARFPGDEAVRRARDLLALHEHGFDVGAPLGGPEASAEHDGPSVLVGREQEVREVSALLRRMGGGNSAALAVCGVGGVGKTRLLAEAGRLAARAGIPAVAVMCQALDGLQPWRELAGVVWAHLRRDLSAPPDPVSPHERDALGKLMSAGVLDTPAGPGHERDPRELTFLLVSLLRRASGQGLLVAFDNAHLLSPYAAELLQHVRKGLSTAPVGFLLATRSEPARWEGVMSALPVAPLSVEEVAQWLGRAWGREPTPEETKEAAHVTDGLPLALLGLTEPGETRPVPARPVTAALPAFRWLATAAITAVGLDIDAALVARVLGLDSAAADRLQAQAASGDAVRGHGAARFAHDRSREAVLEELGGRPALARDLHRRAFEALSARTGASGRADPSLPVRVAQHAVAAGAALPEERAAAACLDAARAEQRGFDIESAMRWAHAGLRLRCDPATRVGLLITLGDALGDGGRMEEAGRRYLAAGEAAEGLPRLAAAAAIRLARRWSAPGQVDRELLHLLGGALDGLGADADEEAVMLRLQLKAHLAKKRTMAVADNAATGPPPGVELARATLLELTATGNDLVRCEVLTECRWALFDFTGPAELLGISERLLEAGVRAGSAHFQGEALMALAVDQLRLGRLADALGTVDAHRAHVARNPRGLGPWLQGALDTLMDLWNGDFQRAEERLMGESLRMVEEQAGGEAAPAETLRQTWMGQYFWLLHERGDLETVFSMGLARQVEQHGYFPIWRAAHVLALAETGRHDEAADRLAAFLHDTSGLTGLPPHGWTVPTLTVLAEACAAMAAGGVDRAELEGPVRALSDRLAAYPGEIALAGWPSVLLEPTGRPRGLLALAAGDAATALRHFDEAVRTVSAAPPHMARLQLDRAKALRLRDPADPEGEATRLLHRSLRMADRLGMRQVAAEARSLLTTD
ncbi:AAA family ATPase [Sphaerisporangium sp. TRM90804]|uniref:AAA family ATPase n=1 Tax=Sphaerisporangium sp. TRM90804 TaxID=3031113 RepID=UPI00244CB433|nr:AAA family ATPase [Sphaerisporangium sp. TRM90804]MDH2426298.1 BTAD domain-containing putative transcriptional regulator [Sphaerisporangium sp. TRM90804]